MWFTTSQVFIAVLLIEVVLTTDMVSNDGDVRFRRYYRNQGRMPRSATAKKERIWPEGIIPFVIASNFSEHKGDFRCCSYVGRRGEGPQAISIGKNCDKFGIVVHELGHVVGFWHEHTRPDRDLYVDIFYKSIQTGQDYNFDKSKPEEVDSLDEPYDFSSIMHYARDTFSRGAFYDTILPKPNSECGGTLMQESGNLAIQRAGICKWHIISPQGHTIFLNITGSTLPSPSSTCANEVDNVITVRDGVSISSPVLDRICGGASHFRTIASSGNRILIQVKSTTPTPSLPFATYYAICGGPIYANEGVIHSPKYPESYPPNSDCQWTIHVDENSQVAIEFVYFHLEQHKECIYDRLILTEGTSTSVKKTGKEMSETFCGVIEKKIIVSKINQISLRFFSDNSVQKSGFELRFSKELNECATEKNICHHYCVNTVGGFKCACRVGYSLSSNGFSCDSTCGGYLKASNGSIASPNFPEMYPNSKTCIWEIEAPEGYHIFLNFTKFTVEGMKTECAYDYVKIGDSEKLCGEYDKPLLFTTPRNRVRIEFSSDSSVERDGFFANFIADFDECQNNNAGCEHTCQNRLGDINSPNYPNDYSKGQNCSWHFVTTPGHRLMLTFSTFQVEEHAQCKYDSVSVFDGGDDSAQVAVCGGRLTAESTPGHIYSHATFSDSKYGKNQDCSWSVRAKTPTRGVRIQFSTFNVESEEGCQYDYVEIYDGPEATQEALVGRFCGDTIPEVITSTGPELLLIMHTDNAEEEKGFVAEYRESTRSNTPKRTHVTTTRHNPLEEPIHDQEKD
uniref:Metalloendopeptidase n=1 Tax=Caenorhabditis tropicalis TaxID=1561998 RepID=A0A1I7TZG3_9PELO